MNNREGYHIRVEIRDKNFSPVETLTYSGKYAIEDAICHLDSKYHPNTVELLKRLW